MRNTKRWPAWLACAAMALLMAGCGGGGGGSGAASPTTASTATDTTPVKYSVTLTMTSGQVGVGRSISMSASVVDSKGADVTSSSTFAWTSSSNTIATVVPAASGSATITGVAVGTATIQVVATVKAADNSTQLPAQTATIAVQPASVSYNLALSNPVLSLVDGQVQPVKATLVDGNGSDVSGAVHDWAWASSIGNVQVSAAQNTASLTGVNSSDTTAAVGTVTVSVTAPNGIAVSGQMLVTVQKNTGYTYRLELSQGGVPINALSVLNGYPQVFNARVIRSDSYDSTADFDGTWSYATTSPTLSVAANPATRQATLSTSIVIGTPTVQSLLQVTAASSKIALTPNASLTVTEQPKWALVYNGPQPLKLLLSLPVPTPVTATLKNFGADVAYLNCTGWSWTSSANVSFAGGVNAAQIVVTPLALGDFTVTATCTAGPEQQPISITIPGTVS
ncbi:hypothetical protein [Cupriavidus sp. 8B]